MAYKKISDLTTATLVGGELLEVEQSGTSKKTSATLTREALKVPLLNSGGYLPANGVAFPATLAASTDPNTLDDYEEGTFTIGMTFGGGNVGMSLTSIQAGYIKIGKLVSINAIFTVTAKGTSTGSALLTGLPFPIGAWQAALALSVYNVTFLGYPHARTIPSSTTANLYYTPEAGSRVDINDTNIITGATITVAGVYFVA